DWSSAVIVPPATAGVPPVPPAFPIPSTGAPTESFDESPRLAVARPEAPWSCSSAMSWLGSYPTTVASYVLPLPTSVAVIRVAPSMTWLFVRTSPVELRTMPVPAPEAIPPENVESMSTSAGLTFAAIAAGLDGPPEPLRLPEPPKLPTPPEPPGKVLPNEAAPPPADAAEGDPAAGQNSCAITAPATDASRTSSRSAAPANARLAGADDWTGPPARHPRFQPGVRTGTSSGRPAVPARRRPRARPASRRHSSRFASSG